MPGSYNILYYDPILASGLLLVAFSVSIRLKAKTQYVGFLALLFGAMTIWYGISAYNLGLSTAPPEVLGLFGLFSLAGILAYPATWIVDNFLKPNTKMPYLWNFWLATL